MKKIIWVFGESATGKKTFIEHIIGSNNMLKESLNLCNRGLAVLKRTILSSEEDELETISRPIAIVDGIKEFINSNNDILLIKGQTNDLDYEENNFEKQNVFKQSLEMFPDIETEVILLEIPDNDISYSRMTQKDWWLRDPEKYEKWLPRSKWDEIVKRHNDKVKSLSDFGVNIIVIDTTDGYQILKGDNHGKSSNSWGKR